MLARGAPYLITYCFGTEFEAGVPILIALCGALPARFLRIVLDPFFIAEHQYLRVKMEI